MKQGTGSGSGSWQGDSAWIVFLSLGFCDEAVAPRTDLEHGSTSRAALNLHAFGLIQGAAVLGDGFWSRGWQDHRGSIARTCGPSFVTRHPGRLIADSYLWLLVTGHWPQGHRI